MDLAFSGLMSAANRLVREGSHLRQFVESSRACFAACIEVAERALAHTGKTEVLLGGGVACNQQMRYVVHNVPKRGSDSHCPPRMYCIDNGTMIARLGWLELQPRSKNKPNSIWC